MTRISETRARSIVRQRSGGICEVCRAAPATDYQHRKNRSQGGRWAPSAALDCCHACHMRMHREPDDAVLHGWTVRSHDEPADTPVWLNVWCGAGWYTLDDAGMYTPTRSTSCQT